MTSYVLGARATARRPSFIAAVLAALEIRRQRKALARLDEAALRDIGIDRASAEAEAQRPVWDVPGHWR